MADEERLIDANALKARFKLRIDWLARDAHDEYTTGLFHGAETDVELIDEIPSVDAVEVVRCRECKSYEAGYVRRDHGWCKEWGTAVRASGFCHHGERRADGN